MIDLLIRSGTIVTADATFTADIAVKNGKILGIAEKGSFGLAKDEIDAEGKIIIPGLIDPHVHLRHPFGKNFAEDDFYTATAAAACGGTTTVIDFAIQWDKTISLMDTIRLRRGQADKHVAIDYALHACPTNSSKDIVEEVPEIIDYGIPSFKLYMIYRDQGRMVDDAIVMKMLEETKKHNGIVGVHAENSAIAEYNRDDFLEKGLTGAENFPLVKPNYVEAEAINRVLYLNHITGGNLYIFHLSTAEGFEMIKKTAGNDELVFAETCIHYLTLTSSVYSKEEGNNFICSPPLRSHKDVYELWKGVNSGSISIISSDHCGFGKKQKAQGSGNFNKTPNGLPGLEMRLPLVFTEGVLKGKITMNKMVELLSTNPAKIFGLYPLKGSLMTGSDADLVIVNIGQEREIKAGDLGSVVDWTPYEGMAMRGFPDYTILRGNVIVNQGNFCGKEGQGEFLKRKLLYNNLMRKGKEDGKPANVFSGFSSKASI